LRRDVAAAYVAAGSRVGAWAIVSAIVYRLAGPDHFGTLALIRGAIGILNYTSVGLAPALIRSFARTGEGPVPPEERAIYSTGIFIATVSAIAALALAAIYALAFDRLHVVPAALLREAPWAVMLIGSGTLFRLFSDVSGALLQTRGGIALDNYLLAASDASWALMTILLFRRPGLITASATYAIAGLFLAIARGVAVAHLNATPFPPRLKLIRAAILRPLIAFGSLVLLAQLAEYFYAPTDYILINHFFGPAEVAAYAPGVQIDMGLLMLVTGLAAVLLPKAALAHGAGDVSILRRYYIRGTLASTALLAVAAVVVWLSSSILFRVWFGPHPPATRQILDLVLLGTVFGGSAAVGRSILIGMGKIKAFTAAALIAGVVNVIASYCFVKYAHLGLRGILYGTVAAVIGRCAIWMPWFVMRAMRIPKFESRLKVE
jgi:O-antigen/teichoic acid export membrane protein